MTGRPRHPKKEVEDAVRFAESRGWVVTMRGGGHAWGVLRCGSGSGAGHCQVWVFSTPSDPGTHAKKIVRQVLDCGCG